MIYILKDIESLLLYYTLLEYSFFLHFIVSTFKIKA